MSIAIAVLALIFASAACALSLAVATRAKRILDPLVEGSMIRRPPSVVEGTRVPDIGTLRDTAGEELELHRERKEAWLLTFLSSTCSGCAAQLPEYKRMIETEKIPPNRAITIVLGNGDDADAYAHGISQFSRVIRSQDNLNSLISAIGVKSMPTFLVMTPDGEVKYSTTSVSMLEASRKELTRA
ncbi:hypothetical protein AB0D11_12950 [Streptomyces monashensis]|uniref:TlpA family protein disulfide reductase n=1 Tax=Streptomyces monashensis TaxID=1678012 RepID=UPI00340716BF